MKGVLKRKTKTYNNKLIFKMIDFLLSYRELDKLIWFRNNKKKILKIFDENLVILKTMNIDFNKFGLEKE